MRKYAVIVFAVCVCIGLVSTAPANAAWVVVEDFEDGAWSNYTPRGATLAVEDESGNKVGKWSVNGNNQGVDLDIPDIVDGTTGTIFYRVKWTRGGNMNKAAIRNSGAWITRSTWESARRDRIMDASAWNFIDTAGFGNGEIVDNTWYSYWMVIDHTADTWNLYGQKEGSDSPTLLSYGGDSDFGLAYGNTDPAQMLRLMNTGGGATYDAWVDDVYVDLAGANTGNPLGGQIPEPASAVLVFLGLGAVASRLRRRLRIG